MTQNTTIAGTILNQLGGSKFIAMTGARNILNLGDGLQFQYRGCKTSNCVRITLNQYDSYDVEFFSIKGLDCTSHGRQEGIMVAGLKAYFEQYTGLWISL